MAGMLRYKLRTKGWLPLVAKWVSPDDMIDAAKKHMLEGRDPSSEADWHLVLNFIGANTAINAGESVCRLMVLLYDMPVHPDDAAAIGKYQDERKPAY